MMFSKSFFRKANQFRKQKWSAPTVMGIFILVCMMLVFGFESMGIAQKEKNLDYRITTPEKCKINYLDLVIQVITKDKISQITAKNTYYEDVSERVKVLTMKTKEEKSENILNMLISGAESQMILESLSYDDTDTDRSFIDI